QGTGNGMFARATNIPSEHLHCVFTRCYGACHDGRWRVITDPHGIVVPADVVLVVNMSQCQEPPVLESLRIRPARHTSGPTCYEQYITIGKRRRVGIQIEV